jgi:hypothetical protein
VLPWSNAMPLRRESDWCHPEEHVGVTFVMVDDASSNRVICRVTYDALCKRAAKDGHGENWLRAWDNHMLAIEALANANYRAGKPLAGGKLLVEALELTPLAAA